MLCPEVIRMFRTKVRHILTSYTRIDFAVIPEKLSLIHISEPTRPY
jgi:hypothetical protein